MSRGARRSVRSPLVGGGKMTLFEELQSETGYQRLRDPYSPWGSLMPTEVVTAMAEASKAFVELPELHIAVGNKIAELTKNEAAYVSSGAAAGITLSVAACIAGTDPELIGCFPDLDGATKREVIIHRSQRNGYDYAARMTGARVVEVEGTLASLNAAMSERTACVLWFAGAHFADGALPIEAVVAAASKAGVPVLVDGAAQIPFIANLWHFFHRRHWRRRRQLQGRQRTERTAIERTRSRQAMDHRRLPRQWQPKSQSWPPDESRQGRACGNARGGRVVARPR